MKWNRSTVVLLVSLLSACGGGGGGSAAISSSATQTSSNTSGSSSTGVQGTWASYSSKGQISLVLGSSSYAIYAVPAGSSSCSEFGTWTLSGNNLTLTPLQGSSCGQSAPYSESVSLQANSLTLTGTNIDLSLQLFKPETIGSSSQVWQLMTVLSNGQTIDASSSNSTLSINNNTYTYTQGPIGSTPACSETGTYTIQGSGLNLSPSSSSTCGDTSPYSETILLNGEAMGITRGSDTQFFALLSGTPLTLPSPSGGPFETTSGVYGSGATAQQITADCASQFGSAYHLATWNNIATAAGPNGLSTASIIPPFAANPLGASAQVVIDGYNNGSIWSNYMLTVAARFYLNNISTFYVNYAAVNGTDGTISLGQDPNDGPWPGLCSNL